MPLTFSTNFSLHFLKLVPTIRVTIIVELRGIKHGVSLFRLQESIIDQT